MHACLPTNRKQPLLLVSLFLMNRWFLEFNLTFPNWRCAMPCVPHTCMYIVYVHNISLHTQGNNVFLVKIGMNSYGSGRSWVAKLHVHVQCHIRCAKGVKYDAVWLCARSLLWTINNNYMKNVAVLSYTVYSVTVYYGIIASSGVQWLVIVSLHDLSMSLVVAKSTPWELFWLVHSILRQCM